MSAREFALYMLARQVSVPRCIAASNVVSVSIVSRAVVLCKGMGSARYTFPVPANATDFTRCIV